MDHQKKLVPNIKLIEEVKKVVDAFPSIKSSKHSKKWTNIQSVPGKDMQYTNLERFPSYLENVFNNRKLKGSRFMRY